MTDDPEPTIPPEGDDREEAADERMVTMLRVRCNKCRRARSEYLANQRKGGAGIAQVGGYVPVCPHYGTVWADGYGPGSEPPEDSGYDRTAPV